MGISRTLSVVGSYWISSMSSFLYTTLPGVIARFSPGWKAVASVMFILPSSRSASKFLAPSARPAPPASKAPLPAPGVGGAQFPGAAGQARPARRESPLEGLGVGEKVVHGGHGVHELLQVEPEAALLVGVLPVGRLGRVAEVGG